MLLGEGVEEVLFGPGGVAMHVHQGLSSRPELISVGEGRGGKGKGGWRGCKQREGVS